jgi:hypothetical protein
VTRKKPLEVVILLDVLRNTFAVSDDNLYRELINGVSTVVRSLNNGDRVRREREEGRGKERDRETEGGREGEREL